MVNHGAQDQAYGNAERDGGQNKKTRHIALSAKILALLIGAFWILPGIAEHWNDWWMKLTVYAFTVASGYGVFALLHDGPIGRGVMRPYRR